MNYPVETPEIRDALTNANRILAVSHANPDADAVASLVSFQLACEAAHRSVVIALGAGTVPETLDFLPVTSKIKQISEVDPDSVDVLVLLDCADEGRVSADFETTITSARARIPVINIDHHVTNTRYGTINLVDPEAAATCEILQLLFEDLDVQFTSDIATVLLSGIQGDTLGLRTPSTTGRTLEVSAALLRAGADLDTIVDYLFRIRPYSTLRLWAQALTATQFTGEVIWTEVTPEMLETAGADESEAEGIVNFLAGTQGARVAAMLYRKSDGWRVSMRSLTDDVDVSELAGIFGGGGHSRAAGCSLIGDESVRESFLQTIAQRVATRVDTTVAQL